MNGISKYFLRRTINSGPLNGMRINHKIAENNVELFSTKCDSEYNVEFRNSKNNVTINLNNVLEKDIVGISTNNKFGITNNNGKILWVYLTIHIRYWLYCIKLFLKGNPDYYLILNAICKHNLKNFNISNIIENLYGKSFSNRAYNKFSNIIKDNLDRLVTDGVIVKENDGKYSIKSPNKGREFLRDRVNLRISQTNTRIAWLLVILTFFQSNILQMNKNIQFFCGNDGWFCIKETKK